jgi:hypothetical protein
MQLSQIISEIDDEIARLQQARNLLAGESANSAKRNASAAKKAAKKKRAKHKLSPEGRKKLSESLKARWAERKKQAAKK